MRTSLRIVAGTIVTILLLIVIFYAGLRSPLVVQQFLLPIINQQSSFQVEAKQLDINLFNGMTLEKLHIWRNGEAPIDATLEQLRLRYSFIQLLQGNMDITTLDINTLKLQGSMYLVPSSAATGQQKVTGSPFPFASVLAQLDRAQPEVSIRHLSITPMLLDLKLDNDIQQIQLKGKLALEGTLRRHGGALQSQLDLHVSDIEASLLQPDTGKRIDAEISQGHTLMNLAVKREENAASASKNPPIFLQANLQERLALHTFIYHDTNSSMTIGQPLLQQLQASAQGRINPDNIQKSTLQWRADTTMRQNDFQLTQKRQQLRFAPPELRLSVQGKTVTAPHKALLPDIENTITFAMKPSAFSFDDTEVNRSIKMRPEYSLTLDTLVRPLPEHNTTQWQPMHAVWHQRLNLTKSSLKIPGTPLAFDAALWQLDGTYVPSQLLLTSSVHTEKLDTPSLSAPVSPTLRFTLTADPQEKTVAVNGTLTPQDTMPTLSFDLASADRPGALALEAALQLRLDPALRQWFPQTDFLQELGPLKLALQSGTFLKHGAKSLRDANRSGLPQWGLRSECNATLSQLQPPARESAYLAKPLHLHLKLDKKAPRNVHTDLALRSEGIHAPPLQKAVPVSLMLATDVDTRLTAATLETNTTLAHRPLLHTITTLENRPKRLSARTRFELHADPAWQTYLPLQPLEALAALRLNAVLALDAIHPYDSLTDITSVRAVQNMYGDLNGTLIQSNTTADTRLLLPKPLQFSHRFHYSAARTSVEARYKIEELLLPEKLHLHNDTLHLVSEVEESFAPKKVVLHLDAEGEKVTVPLDKNSTLDATKLLLPLSLELDAHRTSSRAVCNQLAFSFGDGWLQQRLQAEATLDGQTAAAKGTLRLTPRPMPPYLLSGTGDITLPWSANILQAQQLSFHGEAIFNHMTLRSPRFEVVGLQGRIPFSEALQRHKDGTFGFSYLLTPEPFQRVDFVRIEPYLRTRDRLGAASIGFGAVRAAPLAAVVNIDQNLLQLQQFTVGILGGHFAGRFYINAAPGHYAIGMLGRLSRIDLRELLPDGGKFDAAPLYARTALQFDLNRGLPEGRIDITEIDRAQLLQLLEVIDPDHTDAQLEQVRSALRLGYPQHVAVSMHQGLFDLDVGVSLLAKPIRVRGIPLSPLLQHYAGPYLERLNHLPLE
jgi:hypothetical protein